jgi:hypothetical protein
VYEHGGAQQGRGEDVVCFGKEPESEGSSGGRGGSGASDAGLDAEIDCPSVDREAGLW